MEKRTLTITNSQLKSFINCRRRYFFEYIELLKPVKPSEALEIGSEYHAAVAGEAEAEKPITKALAYAYDKFIKPRLEYIEQEKEFEYHLAYGIYLRGKIDGIGKDCIIEHKTSARVNDEYFLRLQFDLQIPIYLLSQGLNRCLYTVIQKPSIKLKKEETQEEFSARLIAWYDDAEINYNKVFLRTELRREDDLQDCKAQLREIAKEMRNCKSYYRNPAACSIYSCPFVNICNNYSPEFLPPEFVKKLSVNEELS